jgi:hypothetical protein
LVENSREAAAANPPATAGTVRAVSSNGNDGDLPRGALIVVAVGLIASLAAALLTTSEGEGSAAQLEWVMKAPLSDSKAVTVPGGGGKFRLTDGGIRATGRNAGEYELFRVTSVLKIDAGSPVGGARIDCSTTGPPGSEVAQTPKSRASYPRSSEELIKQGVPENTLVEFNSHGDELALLELGDAFESFANERGIKLEWPEYIAGHERWEWFLPKGPPSEPLELGFASFWKTTERPVSHISCTLKTSAGSASVATTGSLPKVSPPIDEQQEEENQERAEEEAEEREG